MLASLRNKSVVVTGGTKGIGKGIAGASEITGLPRDNFEVYEIARHEYEEFRRE